MRAKEDFASYYEKKEDWTKKIEQLEEKAQQTARMDDWRLSYHLMPPVGWLNDPNGLCRFKGEYHVFYQYSPFVPEGGSKYWGHYKSRDLIRWEKCPVMLYPEQAWDLHGVYSGSALVEDDVMYLYYTGNVKQPGEHDFIHSGREHNTALAVSKDGVTVDKEVLLLKNSAYPSDLTCHVRDPKVFAYDGKYYMVLGARTNTDIGQVLVWESEDKYNWKYINRLCTEKPFGFMWECPDLFELDGQWILMVSPQGIERQTYHYQNVYTCGYFPLYGDFRNEDVKLGEFHELDYGFDFYAPQTFEDGARRILIGWMGMPDAEYSNPTVARGWQHCLTFPRELVWNKEKEQLEQRPAKEREVLYRNEVLYRVAGEISVPCPAASEIVIQNHSDAFCMEYDRTFCLEWAGGCLRLLYMPESYGRTVRNLKVDHLESLQILFDSTSMEVFVNGGEAVLSARFYPNGQRALQISGVCDMRVLEFK